MTPFVSNQAATSVEFSTPIFVHLPAHQWGLFAAHICGLATPINVPFHITTDNERILIDSATEIIPEGDKISQFGGRVVIARAGDYCLDCAQQINMEAAKQELAKPEALEVRRAHGYGLGDEGEAPSVISLNGVIANIAMTEFLMMTTGIREPNRHLTYHGLRGNVNIRTDKRRGDCYTCGYLAGSRDRANILRYALPDNSEDKSDA